MTCLEAYKVIKVKRKCKDDSPPEILILDGVIDSKRQRTLCKFFWRVTSAQEVEGLEAEELPVAQIKPSALESLSQLKVNEEPGDGAEVSSEEEAFEYYMLGETGDVLSEEMDLATLSRIHLPNKEIIFLEYSCSEEETDEDEEDEDSNAESFYQNDYPDEDDDDGDESSDYDNDDDDDSSRWNTDELNNLDSDGNPVAEAGPKSDDEERNTSNSDWANGHDFARGIYNGYRMNAAEYPEYVEDELLDEEDIYGPDFDEYNY